MWFSSPLPLLRGKPEPKSFGEPMCKSKRIRLSGNKRDEKEEYRKLKIEIIASRNIKRNKLVSGWVGGWVGGLPFPDEEGETKQKHQTSPERVDLIRINFIIKWRSGRAEFSPIIFLFQKKKTFFFFQNWFRYSVGLVNKR